MNWMESRKTQLAVGITLVGLAVVSLFGSWKTGHDQNIQQAKTTAYVKCQQRWTAFLYVSLNSSRTSSNEANQALDDLISAVTQSKSAEETRLALETYKAARAKQKQTSADNPLPPPPEEVCEV